MATHADIAYGDYTTITLSWTSKAKALIQLDIGKAVLGLLSIHYGQLTISYRLVDPLGERTGRTSFAGIKEFSDACLAVRKGLDEPSEYPAYHGSIIIQYAEYCDRTGGRFGLSLGGLTSPPVGVLAASLAAAASVSGAVDRIVSENGYIPEGESPPPELEKMATGHSG